MILYRPVGLQELGLIYDSGMTAFPARLPQQPIFYPVLQLEYARQTASDWNVQHEQFAGYVTEFKVEDEYIDRFDEHVVGKSQYQELWIPAEEIEEFNEHIVGHIKVIEAYFGDGFQGFIPEQFGLKGKSAVEQFTWLANTYVYKRMDFYLEIKRNHRAVFLNYPFWQTYDSRNPGLKEKTLQAIKEAWLTSFPKTPLPNPVQKEIPSVKPPEAGAHGQHLAEPVREDILPVKQTNPSALSLEDITPVEPTGAHAQHLENAVDEDITSEEQTDSDSFDNPLDEEVRPVRQTPARAQHWVQPVHEEKTRPPQTDPHFVEGIKLGLSGEYQQAIAELSRAIQEDPGHVTAQTSLGVAFHRLGQDDRALACYETTLKVDPIYAEAHYFRANILYDRGSAREAIAGYTVAIGLQPELIEAHQRPGPEDRLTDYSGSPAEMRWIAGPAHRILDLNGSLEANPGQAKLFKERAAQYYRLRNYAQAIADYSSALALQPDDASTLHLRGVAYEQLGQSERALEDYQKASALDPQLSNVYINRGVTLGQMGNLHQSIASLTEAIRLTPRNPDGYFNRGIVYFQHGEFGSAIEDLSYVIRLSPGDEEAYYWRGIANEQTGRQREAIADYRQFLALSRDENGRAEIEQRLNQLDEGQRSGMSSQSVIPDDRQKTDRVPAETSEHELDLHDLIVALGERALNSTWFGTNVNCYGEKAEELYAFTDYNKPIEGRDLLSIASGIRQTMEGDFQAFDPGANAPWIFIRAWEGSGFYIETNDPKTKQQLKTHFQSVEEVDGAASPYQGLFIRI